METNTTPSYQVLVCNIHWDSYACSAYAKKMNYEDLPIQMSIDIPNAVLMQANKNKANFNDIIEQFVVNLLYKKFGHEVNSCQIWLPLD